jgi:tetratricopeptide (TPR) repeat protein
VNLETAIELQRRAIRLDPVSNMHISTMAYYLYLAGRIDESRATLKRASELNPDVFTGHVELALFIAILQGDIETAEIEIRNLPDGPVREQARSMLLYQAGNDQEATAVLDRLIESGDLTSLSSAALILGFQGEIDEAFTVLNRLTDDLQKAPESADPQWIFLDLRDSPFMQALHSDPRWREWSRTNWDKLQFPLTVEIAAALQNFAATGPTGQYAVP